MVGIFKNMPMEEYRAHPGVNGSLLATVDTYCLKTARAELDGKLDTGSEAKALGTAFHSLFLEGKRDYAIRPETYPAPADHEKVKKGQIKEGDPLPWNGNAGWCKKWITDNPSWLTESDASSIEGMASALANDEEIAQYLDGADTEVSIFAEYEGIPVKARIDLLPKLKTAPVLDPKRCRNAKPEIFVRNDLVDFRYFMKAAWHIDVLRWAGEPRDKFWLLAVESDFPFAHSIIKLEEGPVSWLRMGRRRCRAAFQKLKQAFKTGNWPSHGSAHAEEHTPAWMLPEMELTV